MKKIAGVIISIISSIAVIVVIVLIESHSKSPAERNTVSSSMATPNVAEVRDDSESFETTFNNAVLNNKRTVEYEFLSYDIIEDTDIADQNVYEADFFCDGIIPDPNYLVEYTDYQAMRNDYPNVNEYILSNGNSGMTAAEYQAFLEEHSSDYTICKHPKTIYIFVRCRITCVGSAPVDEYINCLEILGVRENEIVGSEEINCYFDASQHTEGEDRIHHYFLYTFHESGESIECVIGCALREDFFDISEDNQYYIGFLPIGLESYDQFDPSIDDSFVALDSIT